jgi:hypothetical protein
VSYARRNGLILLAAALVLHAALALQQRERRAEWPGVPPAPPALIASALALGDAQLFYRAAALVLQNMGDGSAQATPLADYDHARLADWLDLLDRLDPKAQHAPTLAAYYFGQTPDPDGLRRIVAYLSRVGALVLEGRHGRADRLDLGHRRLQMGAGDQLLALQDAAHDQAADHEHDRELGQGETSPPVEGRGLQRRAADRSGGVHGIQGCGRLGLRREPRRPLRQDGFQPARPPCPPFDKDW